MTTILQLTLAPPPQAFSFAETFDLFAPSVFTLGWVFVVFLILWTAWEAYLLVKMGDYVAAIEWTFLQIRLPDDAEETPKMMQVAYEVWGGVHKGPDLNELYFDGYLEAWFSCELHLEANKVRYIMVVPTAHRKIFEGVIYGQFPRAEIKEVEDYTRRFDVADIRKKFDMYGTEIILVKDDIYPIRTYIEYENKFGEEDKYVDPHQAIVEMLSHVGPGEEFWIQILIRPMDAEYIAKWSEEGAKEIAKISGQAKESPPTFGEQLRSFFTSLPGEILSILSTNNPPESSDKDELKLRFFNPGDEAKMKGILQKTSQSGFKVKIRAVYLAPVGQLSKPNIGRLIGAFKQFSTWNLNSLKPDGSTKTNGPNYVLRDKRRYYRERQVFVNFQSRDFWGRFSGQWFNAEELATLYHFPVKYVRTPGLERAKAGQKTPPPNLPYV